LEPGALLLHLLVTYLLTSLLTSSCPQSPRDAELDRAVVDMAGAYQSTDGASGRSFGISIRTQGSSSPGTGRFTFDIFEQISSRKKVALLTVHGAIAPGAGKTIKLQADRGTPHRGWTGKKGIFKYNSASHEINWGDSVWVSAGYWWRQQSGM